MPPEGRHLNFRLWTKMSRRLCFFEAADESSPKSIVNIKAKKQEVRAFASLASLPIYAEAINLSQDSSANLAFSRQPSATSWNADV